jgi:hypothetical protein
MKRAFLMFLLFSGILTLLGGAQEKPAAKGSGTATARRMSQAAAGPQDKQALIREALSAAPPEIAKTATVKDWEGNVLKPGSGAYTCYPTPPPMRKMGKEPMCLDKTWQAWADAWLNHKDFKADQVGIAYMLEGDAGASNTDPYATGPTSDNQWVVSGPHTMVVVPDPAQLEGLRTDPNSGGPFVMWKGTPYAHIMVPLGKHSSGASKMGNMKMNGTPRLE